MQITKIIYKDDEATFMLKEERVLYALKINRKLDIPNEKVEELWYNYIKNNFASNGETILDECLGFFAWWIIGQNELYEEKNLINN